MNQMYRQPIYYSSRNNSPERFGPLLPFLAGVLVTTPFIFLNKNQQQPIYNYPPPNYYPAYNYPVYPMYPMPYSPYIPH